MKVYRGVIVGDDVERRVYVVEPTKFVRELDLRLDLRNHSPTGFSWGYGGSGPAQLALAICADVFGDEIGSDPKVYHALAVSVVQRLPMDKEFTLDENEVRAAVK